MIILMKIIIIITIKCFWGNGHVNNINILYYDRINIPEGIDINKTRASKSALFATTRIF